jgi:hypothetical protein
MSKSTTLVLQHIWRFARIFVAAFAAQWVLLPAAQQWTTTALVATAVAAAEVVYRQLSPQDSARVLSWLAALFSKSTAAAQTRAKPAPMGQDQIRALVQQIVKEDKIPLPKLADPPVGVGGPDVDPRVLAVTDAGPELLAPVPVFVQSQQAAPWPADVPSNPDGSPKLIVGH